MARRRKSLHHGWVLVDKPAGLSSSQAVGRVSAWFGRCKAGHAGTLDPLATGLLPIALGEATKTVPYCMATEKRYTFTIAWGQETDTGDQEGQVIKDGGPLPALAEIQAVLPKFLGQQEQQPPVYSALKIQGKRACDRIRSGESVGEDFRLPSREIEVKSLNYIDQEQDGRLTSFDVTCSKGTYIRALARDIALRLGTFGHIVRLRRTEVGTLSVRDPQVLSLETPSQSVSQAGEPPKDLHHHLKPVTTGLDDIPAFAVTEQQVAQLRHGQPVALAASDPCVAQQTPYKAYVYQGPHVVALGEWDSGLFKPRRLLNYDVS